jgi:hypothetical protein
LLLLMLFMWQTVVLVLLLRLLQRLLQLPLWPRNCRCPLLLLCMRLQVRAALVCRCAACVSAGASTASEQPAACGATHHRTLAAAARRG